MKKNFINSTKFQKFLNDWLLRKTTVVPFIHGRAGIGKTAIIENLRKQYDFHLEILNLNHQEEGDLIGIPLEKDGMMVYSKPEWIGLNEDKENVIIFLDEMDRAPKNILNVSLTLIREYRIHTHKLPKTWKIIAAGNSGINDDFYDTNEMDRALKSRFVHFFYELNYKEFLKWGEKNGILSYILEYIKQNPSALISEPSDPDIVAYNNPRTWEILSDTLKFSDENIWKNVCVGSIGEEVGTSFYTFLKTFNKEDTPISFTDLVNDLDGSLIQYQKKNKNGKMATNYNILNNLNILIKNHKKEEIIKILSYLIITLIKNEDDELVIVIFNTIQSLGSKGKIFNEQIIKFIENNTELYKIYKCYATKVKNIINNK